MNYTELKPLHIPREAHREPIPTDVLPAFGIVRDAPQEDLLLAQVALDGEMVGEQWVVSAYDINNPPTPGHEEDAYGGIMIEDSSVEADTVLGMGEDWVRNHAGTEWVPGSVLEINLPEELKARRRMGVLLVRWSEVITRPVAVPRTESSTRRKLFSRRRG
jgi:hypothetical protein